MRIASLFLSLVFLLNFNVTIQHSALQIGAGQATQQGPAKSGNEPLFDAASRGDLAAIKALIVGGADANAKDNFGETALLVSAAKGHLEVVKALLAAGADPNLKSHNGRTALIAAVEFGRAELVRVLLDAGARANESDSGALRRAAEEGHTDLVTTLLAAGADVNARSFAGTTALMYAATGGHIEMVKALLTAGAEANAKNNDGMDALIAATAKGHNQIAEMLKGFGADIRSERFAHEVQEVARRFGSRLQQTKDFRPLIEELFARRFMDCHVRTMLERKENGIFSQIGVESLSPEIANQVSSYELQRYLIAALNFFHLKTLHRVSTRSLLGGGDSTSDSANQEYPPGVSELLMKYPTAPRGSQNGKQLRSYVLGLEQAASMMRDQFIAHLPEETEAYRKNMERIGNKKHDSKFWEIGLFKLPDKDAQAASKCFGMPVRQLAVLKAPPFYRLFIVQEGRAFKIGALLCTEPPCAD